MSKKLDDLVEAFRLDSLKYESSGCATVNEARLCETTSALYAVLDQIAKEIKTK